MKKAAKVARKREVASKGGRVVVEREVEVTRSAKTGKLVPKGKAKAEPESTVTEKVKRKSTVKIPKKLNEVVDLYETIREKRLAMQDAVKEVAEQELLLKQHLIDNISKSDAAGVIGKNKRCVVVTETVPTIEDEEAFLKFASRKGNEDLQVTKPNMKAIEERWEAGKAVPGVGKFNIVKLSLKKI